MVRGDASASPAAREFEIAYVDAESDARRLALIDAWSVPFEECLPVRGFPSYKGEWAHLAAKLAARSPQRAAAQAGVTNPDVHPLFVVVPGPAAPWERGTITAAPPR